MLTLSRVAVPALVLAVCLFGSVPAWAVGTVLSGVFDGSEPHIATLESSYCSKGPSGYRQTNFTVSANGYYTVVDAFAELALWHGAGDRVNFRVYEGSFNPVALEQNAVQSHIFTKGVTYVLVVQQACKRLEGAWAVAFAGPGSVISDAVADVPSFTSGKFTGSDPTKPGPWTDAHTPYKQSGPIRVSRGGLYYFTNIYFLASAEVALQVYAAPVDPKNPSAHLVGQVAPGDWSIELQAGQDYYFVTQRANSNKDGEFLYILAPAAPLRINQGFAGTWYNPDTPGQGFFLTVYEKLNQVFLAWFTYADDPSPDDEYGHRWMTAFGPFQGPSADLDIEWTAGGAFDSAQPRPEQHVDGSIQLEFNDCSSGQITYGWGLDGSGTGAVSGVIPIRRPTDDSVALCESLYAGPGMPGPL